MRMCIHMSMCMCMSLIPVWSFMGSLFYIRGDPSGLKHCCSRGSIFARWGRRFEPNKYVVLELSIMFPPCLPATIAEKKVIGFNPFLSDQKGFKLMCPDPPPRSSPERVLGGHFEPEKSGSPEPKKSGSPEPVLRNRCLLYTSDAADE